MIKIFFRISTLSVDNLHRIRVYADCDMTCLNTFCITRPLWREYFGDQWIPLTEKCGTLIFVVVSLSMINLSNKQSSCGYFEMLWPSYDVRHCNDAFESLGYQIAVINGNIACYISIEEQFSSCPRQVKQYFDLFWSSRACDDYVIWSLARRRSVHVDLGQPALWCSFL